MNKKLIYEEDKELEDLIEITSLEKHSEIINESNYSGQGTQPQKPEDEWPDG